MRGFGSYLNMINFGREITSKMLTGMLHLAGRCENFVAKEMPVRPRELLFTSLFRVSYPRLLWDRLFSETKWLTYYSLLAL